ncbi:MAG: Spy/CpxP family protein refolding chaperone [Gammaproteobacteria bacterium]|nr:Spy/CpxP family protein refolding chaperone [Gammaproteobacteria bacterium]
MKKRNIVLTTVLAGSVLALSAAGMATAIGDPHCGHAGFERHAHRDGGFRHRGAAFGYMLRQLDLSDAQRDKIFKIRYAQEPALREKFKELRKGRDALRAAALSEPYRAEQVLALAEAQAKTMGALIAMRMETIHRIYRVLTPEQRMRVARWQQHHGGTGAGAG